MKNATQHPAYSRLNDRYQITSLIGSGGMASVYKAHDEYLDRDVAVKLFNAPLGEIVEVSNQEHELQVLARLNHHGLVSLIDAGIVRNNKNDALSRMYLVMELINGPTLKQLISARTLTHREIAQIGFDLAEGLQYIHAGGVIHRDIKPANVLMLSYGAKDKRRRAKLADFGIALLTGTALPDSGITIGTAAYLSPEQAMRENIEPASDIYSLALCLLECFTGTLTFPGTPLESATARLIRDPLIPAGLSPQWAELLGAMTAREPGDRPTSDQCVIAFGELIGAEREARREAKRLAASGHVPAHVMPPATPDEFTRIARITSRLLNAAIVIVVASDDGEPRILAHHGVDPQQIDPARALGDPREGVSPLTTPRHNHPRVSGALLRASDGRSLGSLWVLDEHPHTMSAYDEQNLADMAEITERELEHLPLG